jgi:hypothetical protein
MNYNSLVTNYKDSQEALITEAGMQGSHHVEREGYTH